MRSLLACLGLCVVAMGPIAAQAVEVGDLAPCVELVDMQPDGSEVEQCVRSRDQRYLVLEFFSVTCSDCHRNLPALSQLASDIGATAATRVVAIDRDEDQVRRYFAGNDVKGWVRFPVALDSRRDAKKAYNTSVTPTVFVLDGNNRVVYRHNDMMGAAEIAEIKRIVSQ